MADMTTQDIIARLESRHPMFEGRWATMTEFQRIDFLAVGTWPSTKFVVHGYEVKASRSDWLRELKQPTKALPGMAKCDHWWLACPKGVVKHVDEIPDGWGWIEVSPTGATVKVDAPRLRDPLPKKWLDGNYHPEWLHRQSFAAMARRVAYAESDRSALMGMADIMDVTPALDGAAVLTGRSTAFQKELKAVRGKGRKRKSPSRARRKAEWEKKQETGW